MVRRAEILTPSVYVMMGELGEYLYVGYTRSMHRIQEHSTRKEWWPEVRKVEMWFYPTIDEAMKREIDMIHKLDPKYNKAHKPIYKDLCGTCGSLTTPEEDEAAFQKFFGRPSREVDALIEAEA